MRVGEEKGGEVGNAGRVQEGKWNVIRNRSRDVGSGKDEESLEFQDLGE